MTTECPSFCLELLASPLFYRARYVKLYKNTSIKIMVNFPEGTPHSYTFKRYTDMDQFFVENPGDYAHLRLNSAAFERFIEYHAGHISWAETIFGVKETPNKV
jgi:hypothetical protein